MGEIINFSYYNVITWNKNGLYQRYPLNILNLEFESMEYDYLLFLKFENHYSIPSISNLVASLELIYNNNEQTFVVLTPRKEPPPFTATEEEFMFSFSCSLQYFKKVTGTINKGTFSSNQLLFELLDRITTTQTGLKKLLVRQFPFESDNEVSASDYDVIIPHRGDNGYLNNVLSFLNLTKGGKIYVGIDQEITIEVQGLMQSFNNVSFYNFSPNPVGPYVIRNWLIDHSYNELIFFQDSDDISCSDRFDRISGYMKSSSCQLCGSHELRMDYYSRTVLAVRFPVNVIEALTTVPWHAQLHPTTAITRNAFYACNKFSEERTFGNDTKFLLYSYFVLKDIKNIDEFLYIRKRHSGTLTTLSETHLDSPVRQQLLNTWNYDFERIKSGWLKLEDSSLNYEVSKLDYKVKKL